jgi:hypothetical protein
VIASVEDEIEGREQLAPGAVPLVHVGPVLLGIVTQSLEEPVHRVVSRPEGAGRHHALVFREEQEDQSFHQQAPESWEAGKELQPLVEQGVGHDRIAHEKDPDDTHPEA